MKTLDEMIEKSKVDFLVSIEMEFAAMISSYCAEHGEEPDIQVYELMFDRFYGDLETLAASRLLSKIMKDFEPSKAWS